ncbi:MAG: hypothetical protein PHW24_01915 [Candidatus Moranbacteria bacterium]|nr:hypothetical protein [Candidatus Moranbacteria bacterium]
MSGAGCGGMMARLGKKVVLSGMLSHKIDRSNAYNGTIDVSIYGTITYEGLELQGAKLMMLVIIPQDSGDVVITPMYYAELFPPLMPIRKFREILSKYLNEIIKSEDLSDVEQKSIEKYLNENLAQYSEAASMYEECMQAFAIIRRDLDSSQSLAKLYLVLDALDIKSACETDLTVDTEEKLGLFGQKLVDHSK